MCISWCLQTTSRHQIENSSVKHHAGLLRVSILTLSSSVLRNGAPYCIDAD